MELVISDLEGLEREASRLVGTLAPHKGRATLVTLSGELGVGKTAFTKALARALGVEEVVSSPTFVLEKIYALTGQAFRRLVHIDAYRLEKGEDLSALGFDEIMGDAENLVVLEWPEMVQNTVSKSDLAISLKALPDGSRHLQYA
jgi:tRNA threonylcarbamoyladenosine biosynthesis protein TsaE